jgi:hypothetical protein
MAKVTIIFGKEQANKIIQNIPLTPAEKKQFEKIYTFNTLEEADAFSKGVREAVGWQEVYIEDYSLTFK